MRHHWLVRDIDGQRRIVWHSMIPLLVYSQVINAAWWGTFNWKQYGNVFEHWLFPIVMGIVFALGFLWAVARDRTKPLQSHDRLLHFTLGALLGLAMSMDVIISAGTFTFAAALWASFLTLFCGGTMLGFMTLLHLRRGSGTAHRRRL